MNLVQDNEQMRNYDFNKDIENEKFEKVFANNHLDNYYITQGNFKKYDVVDLNTNETYEVKRDRWYKEGKYGPTGNILIEEYFNLEEHKEGWIHHTTADYYVVMFTDNEYYIVDMNQVKNDWETKTHTWIVKDIQQKQGFHTRNWVTKLNDDFNPKFYEVDGTVDRWL